MIRWASLDVDNKMFTLLSRRQLLVVCDKIEKWTHYDPNLKKYVLKIWKTT